VSKKGQGAALLKDLPLLRECVDAIVAAVDLPVTVKTRIGWAKNTLKDTAQALKGAGIERVVIHARTATQNYGGEPNWKAINEATWLFDCPVTGNGGVDSYESAARMLEQTGCEGVMVGRAAMSNPLVFKSIHDRKDFALSREQEAELFMEYASLAEGDTPFVGVRAHALWLCHGFEGAPSVRRQITQAKSVESVAALLRG
jgi:tRNA-dihydrouridine synthase